MKKLRELISRINRKWKKTSLLTLAALYKSIVVLAPIYTKENEKDGYIRRIKTIDEDILSKNVRIYITGDHPELDELRVRKCSKCVYCVEFNSTNAIHIEFIKNLVSRCGRIYIHSVYRLLSIDPADRMQELLDIPGLKIIWDVHGAVPEECCFLGEPVIGAIAGEIEKRLFVKAQIIICVSKSMERHLKNKYPNSTSAVFIVLPILGKNRKKHGNKILQNKKRSVDGKPVVIYSGGLQKWQNVPEMIQLVKATADYYNYRFLVSDPQRLVEMIPAEILEKIQIRSVPADEIENEYLECHFGLVLRDDNTVNRVACPTKIIEYLEYGIIPILKSENIGDFKELGMNYIAEKDLLEKNYPDEIKRLKMVENNKSVIKTLIIQQENNIKNIVDLINKYTSINLT